MIQNTMIQRLVKRAALAALVGIPFPSMAGEVGIDIRIGTPPPPERVVVVREREPARVVVVEEREPVVYESYVVGYRRNLYDADLRLRIARADEWNAHEELEAARRHEGELAVRMDEQQALIEDLRHRHGNPAKVAELHARMDETADLAADLRKRLSAFDHRIAAAKEDYEASKTLHDRDGMADAADRIKSNEARAASASADLHDAEDRLARLGREEAEAKGAAGDPERLHDAEDKAADLHHRLDVAHDAVYATQRRLTAAQDEVYVALHDRDEALWLLHRDEILAGRYEPERCGFVIDLSIWGGRMPRDPEVIHAYCVHDSGYWRSNPVFVEERVVIVERVTEVRSIRQIQRVREVDRIERVERVEKVVKVEDRRHVAEVAVVERKRFEAETVERKTAVAEHRAPKPVYIEKPAVAKPAKVSAVEVHPKIEQHGADTRADTVRKTEAEESGKGKASAARAEKSVERPSEKSIERPSEKTVERPSEKSVERPSEKIVEKTPEKPIEKHVDRSTDKPAVDSHRTPAVDSDPAPKARRRDPLPDPTPAPQPTGRQKNTGDPRDPRNPRDPRDPRNPGDPRQP